MIPQDTDPLRAKGTDRDEDGWARTPLPRRLGLPTTNAGKWLLEWFASDALPLDHYGWESGADAIVAIEREAAGLRPYPGWHQTRPWYRRIPRSLAAWWRRR